jgi:uncharacterized protein (TIGR00251 family)
MAAVSGKGTRILLHVQPGAPRNEVVGFSGGVLRVRIAAPPLRDKANRELIVFLSQLLGINQAAITILHGRTSRNKTLAINGLSQEQVIRRLSSV